MARWPAPSATPSSAAGVVDLRNVLVLTAATLLPYVPVALAVMPLDEILEFAFKALA